MEGYTESKRERTLWFSYLVVSYLIENAFSYGSRAHSGDTITIRITRENLLFSFPFGEIPQILPSEPSLDYVSERYTVGFHRLEV